jgi:hypothetical protein
MRQRVERECGGWQTGRIICRRETTASDPFDPFVCEFVLATAHKTYTARGRMGSFYRDGKSYVTQPLLLDTEVRCALLRPLLGVGLLFAENPEGRILSLRIIEEKVSQVWWGW